MILYELLKLRWKKIERLKQKKFLIAKHITSHFLTGNVKSLKAKLYII